MSTLCRRKRSPFFSFWMAKIHNLSATALALAMNKIINFSFYKINVSLFCVHLHSSDEATDVTDGVIVAFQLWIVGKDALRTHSKYLPLTEMVVTWVEMLSSTIVLQTKIKETCTWNHNSQKNSWIDDTIIKDKAEASLCQKSCIWRQTCHHRQQWKTHL